jgi:hypothetical protein
MSEGDWTRFETLVREHAGSEPTQARAYGATIAQLMRRTSTPQRTTGALDWMDWERRKALRLLLPG